MLRTFQEHRSCPAAYKQNHGDASRPKNGRCLSRYQNVCWDAFVFRKHMHFGESWFSAPSLKYAFLKLEVWFDTVTDCDGVTEHKHTKQPRASACTTRCTWDKLTPGVVLKFDFCWRRTYCVTVRRVCGRGEEWWYPHANIANLRRST